MSLILISSILLRIVALAGSLHLAWRIHQPRVLLLSAMLALMATRQLMTLTSRGSAPASTEVPGLLVSVLALLSVFVVGRLLREMDDSKRALASSEAHFRQLIEASIDAVVMLDRQGTVLYANPAVTRALGYAPDELIGRPSIELVAPGDRERIRHEFEVGLRSPGTPREVMCDMLHRDGGTRMMETRGARVDTETGEIHVLLSLRDVTEQREAEHTRESLQQQLYHAQKMETVGTLAGGIAHDFNNLLTPILGGAELAQRAVGPGSAAAPHLGRIVDATERARALVQRMLLVGRKARTTREPLDLGQVIDETLELLRASLPRTIEIRSRVDGGPWIVRADGLQLNQVLMNLGTNAAHAMPSGGLLQVELGPAQPDAESCERHPALEQGRWVHLRFADSGIGMEPGVLRRAFEPFFSTRPAGEGSGLGLSMVHGIIEDHGGVVEVQSVPGTGTRFDILLPITDERPATPARQSESTRGGERGCVMLVDDEPAVLAIAQDLLEGEGYRVTAFTDPQQAMESFAADPDAYSVVVTDYTMPNMTGLQLARSIEQLRPDTPVILTTGFAESDVSGPESRLAEVLAKPYGGDELTAAIERAVARARDSVPSA